MPQLLTRLAVVAVLFAISTVGAAQAQDNLTLDPRVGLNAYEALVEQRLAGAVDGLRTLAATDQVMSGDWDKIKGPLALFAKGAPDAAAVWFARPDGSYFTVEAGLTGQNLKDRPYFPGLMAGQEVAGDLVVSKATGKRSAIFAVPVRRDGQVIGALGASISMEKVAAAIDAAIGFPPTVAFYALDREGKIALHRESALLFEFAGQLEGPSLKAAVDEMLAKPEGTVHYDFRGAQRTAIFKKSAATGWVFALRW